MPDPAPILLLGSSGQVGGELLPLLQPFGAVIAPTRAEIELTDLEALRALIRSVQPRWILNAAAYTAVDKAESEPEAAFLLNRDVPRVLGEEARRLRSAVIHLSTDYVFSGGGTAPWREDDPKGPLSIYGSSKLAGEEALAATGAAHVTFRTSWVYGSRGHNFLLTILRFARQRPELKIVDDQHGAPTWSRDLAALMVHTVQMVEQRSREAGSSAEEALQELSGVYHACNAGFTTWFGFAEEFLRLHRQAHPEQALAKLTPIPTSAYPTPATRPKNSRLNCDKIAQVLNFRMPTWQDSTAQVMRALSAQ